MFTTNRQFTVTVNDMARQARAVQIRDEQTVDQVTAAISAKGWDAITSLVWLKDEAHVYLRNVVGKTITTAERVLKAVPSAWLPREGELVVVYPPASKTGRKQQPKAQPVRKVEPVARPVIISVSVQGADWLVSYTAPKPDGTTDGAVKSGKVEGYKPGQATVLGALKAALQVWQPRATYQTSITRISDTNVGRMLKGEMQSRANAELLAEVKGLCAKHQATLNL